MKKYTKLFLGTLCFISSATVLANSNSHSYKGEVAPLMPVTIPNFAGGFDITAGAIYMTPSSSNLNYLVTQQDFEGDDDAFNTYSIDPNYKWGLLLGVGYVFPNSANDVRVDWMSFHNSFSDSKAFNSGAFDDYYLLPNMSYGESEDLDDQLSVKGKVDYSFDAVDLTFGQYINIGPRLQTRLIAGLRYARLDADLTNTANDYYSSNQTDYLYEYSNDVDSSFNGLGPMFGVKGQYSFGNGFGMSGMIDAALLVGKVSLHSTATEVDYTYSDGAYEYNGTSYKDSYHFDSQSVVSPAFDAKFGLNYNYQMYNGMSLGFELGYQVTKYFDVIAETTVGYDVPGEITSSLGNFGLNGPYLTLNLKL